MKKNEHQGISFDKMILEKVNFETDPNYNFDSDQLAVSFGLNVEKYFSDENHQLKLVLNANVNLSGVEPSPMQIFISAAGYFTLHDKNNSGALEEFSEIQAPTMLFPFIREIIANLTMRTDFPPLLIPPSNVWVLLAKHNGEDDVKKKKTSVKKAAPKKTVK
jgi:preprotein translocase subunit SecB